MEEIIYGIYNNTTVGVVTSHALYVHHNVSFTNESPVTEFPNNGKETQLQFWNNPDDLITYEDYRLTVTVINSVLNPILFIVGVPTNALCCLVFYSQGLRDRMNLCLFVLALVDAACLVSTNVLGFSSYIERVDEQLGREYYAKTLVYFYFITSAMRVASGCITMVVSVERCVCVVFPLRANSIMRTRTMGALLAAIVITLILAHSIICFRHRVDSVYDASTGQTHYTIPVTDFFVIHHLLYDILHEVILNFVIPLVTFVAVGVATAITVIQLRTASAWRASASSGRGDNHSQQHQAALTKMLVILSCVFMACSAPLTALSIVRLAVADFSPLGRYTNFFYASHIVAIYLTNINSTVNFFVYLFRSSRFKRDLQRILCCGNAEKSGKSSLETVTTVTVTSF